jgi:hypothetical protein
MRYSCSVRRCATRRRARRARVSRRRVALRVGDHVEARELLATSARPHAVRARPAARAAEEAPVLARGELELARELVLGRLAVVLGEQALARALVALEAPAPAARQPIELAQLVEQRALDAQLAVGLEAHAALGIEALDRVHQADAAGGLQVPDLHAARQVRGEAPHESWANGW